ncbi:GNAT family N-acetyltransferase [Deinococcus sp. Arct2-2]|uniref:GNAT family N-acetyltransferase n=1 Tax=Deinococcus sp. Arct2-2 TaxID=2568653 RepID=UPI0010A4809D|nr:GNAT family N-acetyltransferase [Deinococcus sp. Arct2-2]THF67775.1 GNAT family N-acetyltransferase [Deinococcus sp. Arct2-2]
MLRAAALADAHTIALHRYPAEADAQERPIYAGWVETAMQRGLHLGFLTVGNAGEVISGAGLTLLEWGPTRGDPQPFQGRIVNVWIHPDHRRQGHARAAVLACLNAAQSRGISRLSLGTTPQARALYESLGFRASGGELGHILTAGRLE